MKPVDVYLEQLAAQLGDLPPACRAEILEETKSHLEAMIAARRADGMDENEAWQSARNAFGDAEMVGRDLAREWKRAPRVETVGEPLSRREKGLKIVRVLALALLGYPLLLGLVSWLSSRHLVGVFFLVLTPLMLGFNIYRHQKKRLPWTPTALAGLVLSFAISMSLALKIQFADQLRRTPLEAAFNDYFGPVMMAACVLMVLWIKREAKTTLPWRHSARFAQSPIAAEQEYRLSPLLGSIAGTTMGCISTLWMGWQFFGMGIALLICGGLIAFNLLILRLTR